MAPQQFSFRKTHMRPGSCQAVEKDGPAIGLPECATFCYWRGRFSCVFLFACTNGVFLASVYIYMYTYVRIYEHPLYIQRIDFSICVYIYIHLHVCSHVQVPVIYSTHRFLYLCIYAPQQLPIVYPQTDKPHHWMWRGVAPFLVCFACLAALLRVQCFLFCAS